MTPPTTPTRRPTATATAAGRLWAQRAQPAPGARWDCAVSVASEALRATAAIPAPRVSLGQPAPRARRAQQGQPVSPVWRAPRVCRASGPRGGARAGRGAGHRGDRRGHRQWRSAAALSTGETINAGRVQGEVGPGLDLNEDSDEDGVADWLEMALGSDPADGEDAPADADEDGVPDDLVGGGGNAGGGNGGGDANLNDVGGGLSMVHAGQIGSCGIRADGTNFGVCWGDGGNLPSAGPILDMESFYDSWGYCLIKLDETVVCNANRGNSPHPDGAFVMLDGGYYSICGVRESGSSPAGEMTAEIGVQTA